MHSAASKRLLRRCLANCRFLVSASVTKYSPAPWAGRRSNCPLVTTAQTIEDCMALMTEKRSRHLPVLDGDKLVGLVSIGDVVKAIIVDQEITIRSLKNYITGSYEA